MSFYEIRTYLIIIGFAVFIMAIIGGITLVRMTPFERNPYYWLIGSVLAIGLAGLFSSIVIKKSVDDISKEKKATSHLDARSLVLLADKITKSYGLIVAPDESHYEITESLRRLIDLDLIELNPFPSPKSSWGYCLTNLGRHILDRKIPRELFPKEFCELIRIRYWKGYPKDFLSEKRSFQVQFRLSWDYAWQVFDSIMRNIVPNQPNDKDAITIFEEYSPEKSYDTIMKELVTPWENRIKKR